MKMGITFVYQRERCEHPFHGTRICGKIYDIITKSHYHFREEYKALCHDYVSIIDKCQIGLFIYCCSICSIGVTTGSTFCGVVGHTHRHEYTGNSQCNSLSATCGVGSEVSSAYLHVQILCHRAGVVSRQVTGVIK